MPNFLFPVYSSIVNQIIFTTEKSKLYKKFRIIGLSNRDKIDIEDVDTGIVYHEWYGVEEFYNDFYLPNLTSNKK